ncbi:MAG: MBL fold metallo-hydrolase [Cypionkella sp.]
MPVDAAGAPSNQVNCWLLEAGDELVLVDTAMPGAQTFSVWPQILAGRRLSAIVCTHGHPDHAGQADALAALFSCPVYMTQRESALYRSYVGAGGASLREARQRLLVLAGLKGQPLPKSGLADMDALEVPPVIVHDGDRLALGGRHWCLMTGGGHSPEALCLLSEDQDLLICGDQILNDMAPFIGVPATSPLSNPLQDYFDFLARMEELPDTTIALPGHGRPFNRIGDRAHALAGKHHRRLERIMAVMSVPATCVDLLPSMFQSPQNSERLPMLISVALAHLNYLVAMRLIDRHEDQDGPWKFSRR